MRRSERLPGLLALPFRAGLRHRLGRLDLAQNGMKSETEVVGIGKAIDSGIETEEGSLISGTDLALIRLEMDPVAQMPLFLRSVDPVQA